MNLKLLLLFALLGVALSLPQKGGKGPKGPKGPKNPTTTTGMAIRVEKFSNGGYRIRKIFA